MFLLTDNPYITVGKRPDIETMLRGSPELDSFRQAAQRRKTSVRTLEVDREELRAWKRANQKEAAKRLNALTKLKRINEMIAWNAREPGSNRRIFPSYTRHVIPKRNGGQRVLMEPERNVKTLQRMAAKLFSVAAGGYGHAAAYGFVKGRSVVDAIKAHKNAGSKFFLKLDIKQFFDSMVPGFLNIFEDLWPFCEIYEEWEPDYYHRVDVYVEKTSEEKIGIPIMTARWLCGYAAPVKVDGLWKIVLPQGAPTSPILTNLAMVRCDYQISRYLRSLGMLYTRYADDMLISSRHPIDRDVINAVENMLPWNVSLNTQKTRMNTIYNKNWNLGVMLNQEGNVTVGWRNVKKMKAALHRICEKRDLTDEERKSLAGTLSWYASVNKECVDKLIDRYAERYDLNIRLFLTKGVYERRSYEF